MTFRQKVNYILTDLEDLLVSKNEKYGNSALEPKRVFSKANTVEQLKVRIDDKLSRMSAGTNDNEDTVTDLMGYLVLLKIAEQHKEPLATGGFVKDTPEDVKAFLDKIDPNLFERVTTRDDDFEKLLEDDRHQENIDRLNEEKARAIMVHLQPDGTFVVDCNGYDYDTVIEILQKEMLQFN